MPDISNPQDVIIAAGMPRAGSSWLYRNLSQHPQAGISSLKEINYFSINYDRGTDWFDSLYKNKPGKTRFDISPFYFLDPAFEKNVLSSHMNTKLVIVLREPNEWIKSLYYQIKSFTLKMPPFSEFVKEHTIYFDNRSLTIRLSEFDFLGRVNQLASIFKGNLMLVNFDIIKKDPTRLLREIERFANLPAYYDESNVIKSQVNASQANFKWLYFISTNRHLRSIVSKLPMPGVIKLIQKVLYKEGQQDLKGIAKAPDKNEKDKYELLSNEMDIDKNFPPVFKDAFFREQDIVYL